MLIGLGYKARSGKDTVADYLEKEYSYYRHSFAFQLKALLWFLFGIDDELLISGDKNTYIPLWGMTVREMLQKIGTDALRNNFDKDIWVKLAFKDILDGENQVFTDVRFENEAKAIKEKGGILIRIDRDNEQLTGPTATHQSESELDEFSDWDYILVNNGTLQDLYDGIDTIMEDLGIPKNPKPEIFKHLKPGFER